MSSGGAKGLRERARWKEQGRCTSCGAAERREGRLLCSKCLDHAKAQRARIKAAGLCLGCRAPVASGAVKCAACAAKAVAAMKYYRTRRLRAGKCSECGQAKEVERKAQRMCAACAAWSRAKAARYRAEARAAKEAASGPAGGHAGPELDSGRDMCPRCENSPPRCDCTLLDPPDREQA